MNRKLRFRFLLLALIACTIVTAGSARSTERVSGSWFANERLFGLVFQKTDIHPYFLYGNCETSPPSARVNLEVDPKLFGDAVTNGEYIIVQWTDGSSKADLYVEAIVLNEAGQHGWTPFVRVEVETLRLWASAPRLELTLGVRAKDGFKARQSYLLPNEGRTPVLNSFIQSCFAAQPAEVR